MRGEHSVWSAIDAFEAVGCVVIVIGCVAECYCYCNFYCGCCCCC